MSTELPESRSLALTPTWSVAAVLTIFVAVSLLVERSIHRLSSVSASGLSISILMTPCDLICVCLCDRSR